MPVTARLSKRFYEALGEDVANELVDWFNAVDATYKTDLRDLIEVQAQRFDAKLQQGLAELRGEMRVGFAQLRAELLKWMFLFWLGTVGVALASVLTR
ncbi:MAG: hypothetical protein ABSB58_04180 [Gemmatimonadales bacterium]|jgi:hypothetical protein